jgi:hypothetical protein
MPLKITEAEKEFRVGTEIPRRTIVQMVQNFVNRTFKGYRKVTRDNDSHAVYYSKREIDELFRANGYDPTNHSDDFGLRIYLGVHGDTQIERTSMPRRPEKYFDQHTVILVCTRDKVDQLDPGHFVSLYQKMSPGTGLEEGEICPPPRCSTAIDDDLQP